MSTEAQLKALSNSELASGTQIPALKHRTVNNAIIEEMYDAQSRGNVLSGVQTATSLASGDEVFVIRSGEAYLLDADELGFVSTLADLTDVNIPAPSNDQVLAYNFGTSKWMSKDVSSLSSVVSITGTATTNQMVKFTGLSSIGNSIVSDNGTTVNIAGNLSVDNNLTVGTINSGTATDFVKGDGSLDGTTYQDEAEKNQANGYAPLDSGAKIPLANLPDSILGQVSYQGTWAASTNTPTLDNPPASTTKGEYYVASDDGTQFGIEFKTGDWIISNGTAWEKVDNTDAVTSVFGRLGNVLALQEDYDDFYVTLDTFQQISGRKNFDGGINSESVVIQSAGSTNSQTEIANIVGNFLSATGTNGIGFNEDNNIYFTKDNSFGGKGGVLAWNNTENRTYTLPDASGTLALTSDLADYVTLDTEQDITGEKTFDNNTLRLEDAGNGLVTVLGNINSNTSTDSGLARFGFNFQNNIFFSKGVSVGFNAGVFAFNNTDARTYTLPDASGTFAFTSDLNTLNASNITTGTLADARLSGNVALKGVDNNFSVGQTMGDGLTVNRTGTSNYLLISGDNDASQDIATGYTDGTNSVFSGMMRGSSGLTGAWNVFTGGAVRMSVDSSGNVGIDADISMNSAHLDWWSNANAIQMQHASISGGVNSNFGVQITTNAYFNGVNWKRIVVGEAANYFQLAGVHVWRTALTGSADSIVTFTERMRIDSSGAVSIAGSLSKGSGSFKIDHPLPKKKDTHNLIHSFVEAPQADNIYRGKINLVDGKATVNLDEAGRMTEGTFVLLNGNIQCFTSNESGWTAIRGKVEGNILTIEAQDAKCTDTISWLVIGERIDQHMIDTSWTDENGRVITEPLKKVEPTPSEEITE